MQTATWSESVEAAKIRRCDLYSLAAATPERLKYMDFTDSYIDLPVVMATRNDKFFVDDISSIKDKPIGIVEGYAIAEFLRNKYPDINIIDVPTINDGMRMLERGELYGYIDNLMVIADLIQKKFTGELKISARLEEKVQLAIGTRNDEAILHDIFQSIVKHTNRNEAEKQRIYNSWVSVRHEMGFDYRLFWQIFGIILLLMLGFLYHYYRLRKYSDVLKHISVRDPLTNLYNRIRSDEILQEQYDILKRYGTPCGIIMIDVDDFKQVNDRFGHQMGDTVLHQFADLIRKNIRITDKACRWGGEEFLIICPRTEDGETEAVATKILNAIRNFPFAHGEPMTASLGVSELQQGLRIEESVEQADSLLYRAKEHGRNQVQTFHAEQ